VETFARQSALFSLALAEVLIVNLWAHDIGELRRIVPFQPSILLFVLLFLLGNCLEKLLHRVLHRLKRDDF